MVDGVDPLWQEAARHIVQLGSDAAAVLAPPGFEALLPGCRNINEAIALERVEAVVLHKGMLGDIAPKVLTKAANTLPATFANEVFVVLSRVGRPLAPDAPHILRRSELVAAAQQVADREVPVPHSRRLRMPATYLGHGRVLLETASHHLMLVDGADTAIVPHLIRDGVFDPDLTAFLAKAIAPGMTFLDIGANFGTYTLVAAQLVGAGGRVCAVEADPAVAALLRETVTMNGFAERCTVISAAAGARNGEGALHRFGTRIGSSTMVAQVAEAARADYGETVSTQPVACRTIDSIAAENTLERIDWIKIDVEGLEHEVLLGAQTTINQHRPRLIVEWHNAFFGGNEKAAHALHEILTVHLRYRLHRIEAGGTTRAIGFDELLRLPHSEIVAEPAEQERKRP
jgi:FkbM family methyltransferase